MRSLNGLLAGLAGLVAAGLAGCSGSAPAPAPYPGSAPPTAGPSSSTAPAIATGSPAAQAGPAEPATKAGAHTAAVKFYRLLSASRFEASWALLAPAAQRAVPRAVWVSVHNGCPSADAGTARVIKSVLVFGNAAIVTEAIAGAGSRLGKAHDVFNYANGHWKYMPNNLSIYQHGSVTGDIAAAKAQGFCTGRKASPL